MCVAVLKNPKVKSFQSHNEKSRIREKFPKIIKMSKNDEKDEFERPPTPEAPHGNVMDKAGLKPRSYEKRRRRDVFFFFLSGTTHTHLTQAYKNMEFMNSPAARHIRILCEYQHPWEVLQKENVKGRFCSSVAPEARLRLNGTKRWPVRRKRQRVRVRWKKRQEHSFNSIDWKEPSG